MRDVKILRVNKIDEKWLTVNPLLPPVSGIFPEIIIFIIYQPVVSDELCINQNVKKWGKYSH